MHAFFSHCRIFGRSLLKCAEDFRQCGELTLQHRCDLEALRHDVVEQEVLFFGCGKCFLQQFEAFGIDRHGFVCKNIEACIDRLIDILGFKFVVAGEYDNVARFLVEHFLKVVGTCVDFLHPMRRVLLAVVVCLNLFEVRAYFVTIRSKNVHHRIDLLIHRFLNEIGVKMSRIESDQLYF